MGLPRARTVKTKKSNRIRPFDSPSHRNPPTICVASVHVPFGPKVLFVGPRESPRVIWPLCTAVPSRKPQRSNGRTGKPLANRSAALLSRRSFWPEVQRYARDKYAPVRVSTLINSPSLRYSGTWTTKPVSSFAGLLRPVAELPRTPGLHSTIRSTTAVGN